MVPYSVNSMSLSKHNKRNMFLKRLRKVRDVVIVVNHSKLEN